jgi:hypothetical protein
MPERDAKTGRVEIGKVGKVETKGDLLQEGGIEDLTRQGRVLTIWEGVMGGNSGPKKVFHAFVPPQGVTFGDKVWEFEGGGLEFFVAGKSVGLANIVELDKEEAAQILKRRDAIIELIGRKDTFAYEGVSDDEVYRSRGKYRVHPRPSLNKDVASTDNSGTPSDPETLQEPPVLPTFPDSQDSPDFYAATFRGQDYKVARSGTSEQFQDWFTAYAPATPICDSCERLIFPGPVGVISDAQDNRLFQHFGPDCAESISFGGTIDGKGKFTPAFEEGTLIDHMISTGKETMVVDPQHNNPVA